MRIKNISSFPRNVRGVDIAPGESEDVDTLRDGDLEELRQSNKYEVVEPETTTTDDSDDKDEDSKSEEKTENNKGE